MSHLRLLMAGLAVAIIATLLTWAVTRNEHPYAADTVFGSTVSRLPGETRADALARIDQAYGPVPLVRVYASELPPSWRLLQQQLGDVDIVISFKAQPARVLSGALDDRLRQWFANASSGRDTYWTYFHEPEDDVEAGEFTAAEFRQAWEHVAGLAAAEDDPSLHATVVLMCYTVNDGSGRDYRDYLPSVDQLDVLAWDCYNHGSDRGVYTDPQALLQRSVAASRDVGVAWGVAELGARLAVGDDGTGRAAWLGAVGEYARNEGARFVTYFDADIGADFRLDDAPSIQAWRALVLG